MFASSGCRTVVVVQQAAQSLATLERTCVFKMTWFWVDEPVTQALVIALGVIVGNEVVNGFP
jgi:hypothetical protein